MEEVAREMDVCSSLPPSLMNECYDKMSIKKKKKKSKKRCKLLIKTILHL